MLIRQLAQHAGVDEVKLFLEIPLLGRILARGEYNFLPYDYGRGSLP